LDRSSNVNGDPRYRALLDEMWKLHCKKGHDYGSDEDFLANLRASQAFGIAAWVGAMVRANDKMIRIKNAAKGVDLANESLEDSLMDLAAYALLALVLYREAHSTSSSLEEKMDKVHKQMQAELTPLNEAVESLQSWL